MSSSLVLPVEKMAGAASVKFRPVSLLPERCSCHKILKIQISNTIHDDGSDDHWPHIIDGTGIPHLEYLFGFVLVL